MQKVKTIIEEIKRLANQIDRQIKIMGLCGTHSQTIAQHGLKKILPENIKLVSGPGCPVCVTPNEDVDALVKLALTKIPIATYGDALHLSGNYLNLVQAREKGSEITAVYSIKEALKINQKKKNLVFFGIGFETTAPMSAWAIKKGLTIYSAHKLFPPAMEALLNSKELRIDGFINPGHVSTIIGLEPYRKFSVPQVIAGFEPEDVLIAIYLLLKQIISRRNEIENEYSRSVKPKGNQKALKLIKEVFKISSSNWRGLGEIPDSGLEIRKKFKNYDAKEKYKEIIKTNIPVLTKPVSLCQCATILRGLKEPQDCPLFKKKCTPQNPQGACMVSIEGACRIEAEFLGIKKS